MDREIKCTVKIPEGFEPSREDVERLKRDVWDSMIERLGEMLLAGEPKRALLPEVVSLEPGENYGCLLADAGARAALRHVEVVSNGWGAAPALPGDR